MKIIIIKLFHRAFGQLNELVQVRGTRTTACHVVNKDGSYFIIFIILFLPTILLLGKIGSSVGLKAAARSVGST